MMEFDSEPSSIVPKLVYYTGGYPPSPDVFDARPVFLQAAELGPHAVMLRTASDWAALVATSDWRPRSPQDVQAVCEELVVFVVGRPNHILKTVIFRDSSMWALPERELPLVEPDRTLIKEVVEPPRVAHDAATGSWTIALWAIEDGETARYQCRLTARDRALDVQALKTDSLPCSGLMASCGWLLETLRKEYGRKVERAESVGSRSPPDAG